MKKAIAWIILVAFSLAVFVSLLHSLAVLGFCPVVAILVIIFGYAILVWAMKTIDK